MYLPALFGNYDRPRDQPTDQRTDTVSRNIQGSSKIDNNISWHLTTWNSNLINSS